MKRRSEQRRWRRRLLKAVVVLVVLVVLAPLALCLGPVRSMVAERVSELGLELYGRVAESWVGVPMASGNQVNGMMAVQNFTEARIYGEHERELLTAVANQTAIAIENSNLFEQEQARARREQILRVITARVRGSTDVDTVMRTAAQEVGRALGRQTFVYLSDGEEETQNESNE